MNDETRRSQSRVSTRDVCSRPSFKKPKTLIGSCSSSEEDERWRVSTHISAFPVLEPGHRELDGLDSRSHAEQGNENAQQANETRHCGFGCLKL